MTTKLSTQPYKGARDLYPEDMQIRNFIFETWKKVARSYGFEEYDFPILEPLEIFAAKSGEELVTEQLFSFKDRGDRMLAVRPELTPGTVRLIAQRYNELPKPIKWFMIGNNWRYERPQMGRGREFYQLEANIFGVEDINADFEIFSLIIAIIKEFGANETMFELRVNDRRIINGLLLETLGLDEETAIKTRRLMDRYRKLPKEDFIKTLKEFGLSEGASQKVCEFLESDFEGLKNILSAQTIKENLGYKNLLKLFQMLKDAKIDKYCLFDPAIIRGFDYSDGLVYEAFDKNPNNRRSMFGGERFDRLVEIFDKVHLPATGFGFGDWTLLEFLKNWNLLPEYKNTTEYFVALWPEEDSKYLQKTNQVSYELRKLGKNVYSWIEPYTKLDKQLKYADKKQIRYVVIVGESEIDKDEVTIKDLVERSQTTIKLEEFLKEVKKSK